LFVKLRQFPSTKRQAVAIDTERMAWESASPGVEVKRLYEQSGFSDRVRLERWSAGATSERHYRQGAELFILAGELADEHGSYCTGTWPRLPADFHHAATSRDGCTFYIKEGGFPYLRAGT